MYLDTFSKAKAACRTTLWKSRFCPFPISAFIGIRQQINLSTYDLLDVQL